MVGGGLSYLYESGVLGVMGVLGVDGTLDPEAILGDIGVRGVEGVRGVDGIASRLFLPPPLKYSFSLDAESTDPERECFFLCLGEAGECWE